MAINLGQSVNVKHPLANGLVAWLMSLNGQSGRTTLSDIFARYHGSLVNGTTWAAGYGTGSPAVSCDGTDDVVESPIPASALSSSFSVSLAVNAAYDAGTTTHGGNNYICNYGRGGENIGIAWTHSSGSYGGSFYMQGGGSYPVVTWSTKPTANSWWFITAEWDGSTMASFINGVSQGTTANSTWGSPSTEALNIGAGEVSGSGSQPTQCKIGTVLVYNRALGADRLKKLYAQWVTGFPEMLNRSRNSFITSVSASPKSMPPFNTTWRRWPRRVAA